MNYCTRQEVQEMLKDDAMNIIIGDQYIEDPAKREELIGPIIDAAVEDAEGYIAKRYSVPLIPVPKVINKFTKDIALYNLYSRIGIDENGEEKNYLNRYNSAIKFLVLVTEGKVSLGVPSDDLQTAASTGFSVKSNPRLFGRNSLRGM